MAPEDRSINISWLARWSCELRPNTTPLPAARRWGGSSELLKHRRSHVSRLAQGPLHLSLAFDHILLLGKAMLGMALAAPGKIGCLWSPFARVPACGFVANVCCQQGGGSILLRAFALARGPRVLCGTAGRSPKPAIGTGRRPFEAALGETSLLAHSPRCGV